MKLAAYNLKKSFGKREVIKDVSLEVEQGKVVGLLGANGAGKSTTFYMIVGFIPSDAGRVVLNDKDISSLPLSTRGKLGINYLPQDNSVFRNLTVEENLKIIYQLQNLNSKEIQNKIDKLLNEYGLNHIRHSLGISLSGGESRRLQIARCFASDPIFVMLDEPFAGVDPISIEEIQKLIMNIKKKNVGVLITDHNVRETLSMCDTSYIIGEGRVIAQGTKRDILNNEMVKKTYLGENFQF